MKTVIVERGVMADPSTYATAQPTYTGPARRLRSYAWDPSYREASKRALVIDIPYEEINGDSSRVWLEVSHVPRSVSGAGVDWHPSSHPNEWLVGVEPSTHDVRFATQMVYAVAQWTIHRFRRALGREPDFAFPGPLVLHLFSEEKEDVSYERSYASDVRAAAGDSGAVHFGWFRQRHDSLGASQRGAIVSTALSHDVIVHEVTHALIDGVRPQYLTPSNPDVLALHEAIADLVTLFAHFAWPDVVSEAIRADPQDFSEHLVRTVARQFGQSTSHVGEPLRTIRIDWKAQQSERAALFGYDTDTEPHQRGLVLVKAVFEAFADVYQRKADPILALHRRGDRLDDALIRLLAAQASKLADQFLDIVIRALDYLPTVDPTFGEYLRALITADRESAPDDPWGYREALIYAFRRQRIPVEGVDDLSEASLTWSASRQSGAVSVDAFRGVASALAKGDSPGDALREILSNNDDLLEALGLKPIGGRSSMESATTGPVTVTIEHVRALRRAGTHRRSTTGTVITLTARRELRRVGEFLGGSTLVLDERGDIKYHIWKNVDSEDRFVRQVTGDLPHGVW